MCNWVLKIVDGYRDSKAEKARLEFLIEEAFKRRRAVNIQRENEHDPEHNETLRTENRASIEQFRECIAGSLQLRPAVRLRIEQRGIGTLGNWGREWTRAAFATMIDNCEIELERVESQVNFRIAIATACLAVFGTVLAGISAFADVVSAFFK